jgi:hypothetical protein|nr:MAG TPA: hypothetical protein [Caudoviricetes sp.]
MPYKDWGNERSNIMKVYMLDDFWIGSYCVTCIAETKKKCIEAAWKKIGEMFPGYVEQYKNRSEWVEDNWIEDKVEEITLGECIIR